MKLPLRLNRLLLLFALMLGIGFSNQASASHFAAVDIWYDYIGTGPGNYKYRVYLAVYKACEPNNAGLGTTEFLQWKSSCGSSFSRSIPMTQGPDTLDQLCANFAPINACRVPGSPWPAFERRIYSDTITLPYACVDWTFYWTSGTRNSGVNNLNMAGSQSIYVEAGLNNVAKYNNSSPRYLINPVPYLCVNQPATYLNGPYDPDIDSMRSVNWNPMGTNATNFLAYFNPPAFTLANPIASAPTNPYTVNVNTATATFTPTQTGKFVLAFKTNEYDRYNGTLLGWIHRDVQVSVLNCNAAPPNIDTIPQNLSGGNLITQGYNGNVITACPGAPLTFQVNGSSNSISNTVILESNNTIVAPGSTFNVVGNFTNAPVGTFTWTPTGNDIGDHTIIFTAKDSTCNNNQPIVLKNYMVVLIKVLPGVDAGPDGFYCGPNSLPWQINVTGPPGLTYAWSGLGGTSPNGLDCVICPNPKAAPPATATYVVTALNSTLTCKDKDTITVFYNPPSSIDAGPNQVICANQDAILNPSISPIGPNTTYFWTPGATLNDSTLLGPTAHPMISTYYTINVTDENGCKYKDSMQVILNGVAPIINAFSAADTVCPEGSTQLFANIAAQPCGLAQSSCVGGTPADKFVGTGNDPSSFPTPFYMTTYSGGSRMQILYTKDDLLAAGLTGGFINSMAFNIANKFSGGGDVFHNFTIDVACTNETALPTSGSNTSTWTNYGGATVFAGNITTTSGWNTFNFSTPYYWDGNSSLVVNLCWGKEYGLSSGNPDEVFVTNTSYTSVKYLSDYYPNGYQMGHGCSAAGLTLGFSTARPNTRFNVCSSTDYSFSWSPATYLNNPTIANPVASGIAQNTSYIITVTANSNPNCKAVDTVNIGVDNSNAVDAQPDNPVVLCRPGYMQLNAVGIGLPPSSNLPCGTSGTVSCTTTEQKDVHNSTSTSTTTTSGATPFFNWYGTARTQYLIRNTDMSAAGMKSGTLTSISLNIPYLTASATTVYQNFRISIGCTQKNAFATATDFLPVTQVLSASSVNLTAGWNTFTFQVPYNWDTTQNLVVQFCYSNGSYTYNQAVTDVNVGYMSAIRNYSDPGDACVTPLSSLTYTYLPTMRFNYCPAPPADFQYTWAPGTFLSDSSVQAPLAYIPQSTKYYVYTVGRNGCRVRDSVDIYVPKHYYNVNPSDTAICYGESVQLAAIGGPSNGASYQWFENGFNSATTLDDATSRTPLASPLYDTDYTVVISDSVGCADTFAVRVTVKPVPVVNILNNDTTIKYGQSVQLFASGAYLYSWSPLSTLSDPNVVSPVATPTEPTTYTVVGLASNGCRSSDTVRVNIDYRDNLFVPSAFTPNGDGKNDVFKVANLTFQKIIEFRVFNRWGQEIYTNTDGRSGWDGTWKGVAQDMGTYQYIIRVGYPDGFVETYKGDITLVR